MNVFYLNILSNVICSCGGKAEFSAYSMSHDPLEINLICWFAAQKTFVINIVENAWKPWCSFSEFFDE